MSNPPDNSGSPTQSTPTSYTLPNHNKATHAAPRPAHPYINPYPHPNQTYPNRPYPNRPYPNRAYPNRPYPNRPYPNQWNPSQAARFPGNSVSPTNKPIHILAKISSGATLITLILLLVPFSYFSAKNSLHSPTDYAIFNLSYIIPISNIIGFVLSITALREIKSHPEWGGKGLAKANLVINSIILILEILSAIVLFLFFALLFIVFLPK